MTSNPILYGASGLWYRAVRALGANDPSLRNLLGLRRSRPMVVAVGGNLFKGDEIITAQRIVQLIKSAGGPVVITHGNGPQVGRKLEEAEAAGIEKPIHQCTAETQQEIGAFLAQPLIKEGEKIGLHASQLSPQVITTRVIVDPHDGAFGNPTKYIGDEFPLEQFASAARRNQTGRYEWERHGMVWQMKEIPDKKNVYRRVVSSPKPIRIHPEDMERINNALNAGKLVIAAGGGGIPMFPDGTLANAVVDKDLSTALLCLELQARKLIISTRVSYVAHGYGTSHWRKIRYYWTKQAIEGLLTGEYPAGSRGEKIEAAINALRGGVNIVLITSPRKSWMDNQGTTLTRGPDLTGRLRSLAVLFGYEKDELQRWLVK